MKQDRTRDIVGDIGYYRVVVVWWHILEDILMMDRYGSRLHESIPFSFYHWSDFITHIALIEDLDHIWIEFDEIESRGMMREDILCECTISRSYFDDMATCDIE
jgi:hypothetical protein